MMRKAILMTVMMMVAFVGMAKDLKTVRVTTDPRMVCNNCENKIQKTLRFEKGIQKITTDLENQVVTVTYDAEKTDEAKILKAFEGMKYKATVLGDECEAAAKEECAKAEGKCKKIEATECLKLKEECREVKAECCKKAEGQCKKTEGECKKAEVNCKKAEGECKKAEGECKKAEGECCKKEEKK